MASFPNKLISLQEAVAEFVHDGDRVYLGGFLQQDPMAAVHEMIRQGRKRLSVSKAAGLLALDLLMGAGSVSKVITSYIWNPLPMPAHGFARAVQEGFPRRVDLHEYSLLALSLALFAGAQGLPYIPTGTMQGSDLLKEAVKKKDPLVQRGRDPFSGDPIIRLAPLRHDVGFIQVQRADRQGNAQGWGFQGDGPWGILSCERIVVCAEEIVPHSVIRKDPDRTMIPSFRTSAVVKAPFGAHPFFVMGYYDIDWPFLQSYEEETRTPEGFDRFVDQWIRKPGTHVAYRKKVGEGRLSNLRPREAWQPDPVSYGRFPVHAWSDRGGRKS